MNIRHSIKLGTWSVAAGAVAAGLGLFTPRPVRAVAYFQWPSNDDHREIYAEVLNSTAPQPDPVTGLPSPLQPWSDALELQYGDVLDSASQDSEFLGVGPASGGFAASFTGFKATYSAAKGVSSGLGSEVFEVYSEIVVFFTLDAQHTFTLAGWYDAFLETSPTIILFNDPSALISLHADTGSGFVPVFADITDEDLSDNASGATPGNLIPDVSTGVILEPGVYRLRAWADAGQWIEDLGGDGVTSGAELSFELNLQPYPIPEPAMLTLLAVGLAATLYRRRRFR